MKVLTLLFIVLFIDFGFGRIFKIDREKRNFVDDKGRVNIFHGVNIVVKLPPYLPIRDKFDPFYSLNDDDIKLMKKYGFNVVRLGVIWESIEKSPGVYDYEHLNKVEEIVNLLGSNGIAVIIDAHQDMFSRIFCGEGVPVFYAKELSYDTDCKKNIISKVLGLLGACIPLKTFNWKYDKDGLPEIEGCKKGFIKYHQSPELTTIYNSFYKNELGIQDKFIEFWKVVATKFKSNPYILGYDLWNEPFPGNLWSDVKSMWPGNADHYQVLPFYQKLDKALRKIDNDYVSLFEAVPFPDTLPFFGGRVAGGFTETPAGDTYLNNQILSLHSYCCMAGANVCAKGEPTLIQSKDLCRKFHMSKIKSNNLNAKNLGVPFIVTEFGACSNSDACYYEMEGFIQAAEETSTSWCYWNYKPYGDHTTTASENSEGIFQDNGQPQPYKIKALTRTYIQAYQGTPITSYFDVDNATYIASYIYDKTIDAATVLYYHKDLFYHNGYSIIVTDESNGQVDININFEEENYIGFKINQIFESENPIINVKFSKK